MRRTAADFAREAPEDGPYELPVGSGKSERWLAPRPYTDMTLAQQREHGRLLDAWAAAAGNVPAAAPTTKSGATEMDPSEFVLRFRFGALTARAATDNDPRTFVPAQKSDDYDAFHRDWVEALPWEQVAKAMRSVDDYYDPTPAAKSERAAADADPDGDAAGKSDGDATS